MRTLTKTSLLLAASAFMLCADFDPAVPGRFVPIGAAEAVVGRPATPVSYAGVARRTTRRVIRRTTIYVVTLPPACTVVVVEGTSLHFCGGTYYQPYGTQYVVVHVD